MRRTLLLSGMVLLLTTVGTAQTTIDRRPGLIGASSPLYGMDLAADQAFVDWGITDPGNVAHERASEALEADERNDTEARERALEEMNDVAEEASSNSTEGLTKAQAVLEALQQRIPDDADTELNAAVDVVNRAQDQRTETNRAQDRSPADQTILHSPENNAGS